MSLTPKPGDPTWVDLYTTDLDRAIAFYGELFGWTADRGGEEFGGYTTLRKDGRAVAGAMGRHDDPGDPYPDRWTVYLNSPDALATTAKTSAAGGNVIVEPMAVADTADFRYTTIHAVPPMGGGVLDAGGHLAEGIPGSWTVYFGVDDVDKAAERAVALGGTVAFEPMNTPYGRLAGLIDPTGAHFSIGGNAR